jgi:hypothetical protein
MPKPIFTESSTDYMVMTYPAKLLDEPGFGDKLDAVLEGFRQQVESGVRVFDYVEQDTGQVLLKFHRFTAMREVGLWFNRIEKAMQEICAEPNAA